MSFLDLAKSRYTTKRYSANEKIADEKIQQLKEILRLSPSSINSQPWKFIFVSDEIAKQELASVSFFNEQKINEASHLVVFSVIESVENFEEQIRQNLPEGAVNYYNNFLKPLPEAEIKSWFEHQVYLSLGFFLSACASLEIDSSPMEGIKNEEYDKILQLSGYKTLFAVAIGYRNPDDSNQPSLKPKSRLASEAIIQSI
ncbi:MULTISPECIES: nitroreductase family protein [unclassified Arcicella]|uniref:nitroreductase family protein n=1 Tax=unclassified Arcicella TaxID=2644986 RepID=UPI00285BFD78|nr:MULTISPECIES: nitroreductase family protein [unclassified Arcicella]MDR6563564.1 nitroreductase/dihydropteridine reductase [Arcicella sp. BE51]MDR6813324.1 nitroreductase/dihydropteridine reductase [Arcicella sp. BE140]MDR6824638.1 nitroreductase/dihydropteridine reductase [Arcicella sp. BE139]